MEAGHLKIVPRTVTVSWRWDNGAWRAVLGSILPGDDVAPVLTDGTLTLTGEQAAYYQVADEDQTAPPIPRKIRTEILRSHLPAIRSAPWRHLTEK